MEQLKTYLLRNFEQLFVLLTLVATAATNYLLPLKLAFLNFYFLPVILAGYYLGRRKAVLGAFLCMLLIAVHVLLWPESFHPSGDPLELYAHLPVWGGFLILAGAVVGRLHEKLTAEVRSGNQLNDELQRRQADLEAANAALRDYGENLEAKVQERTDELEQAKRAVEAVKTKVEDTLYATMDSSVVNLIIEGRLRNEKRPLSVLFSDLAGFTSYSEEVPPEIVIRDLNRYLGDMEPVLLAYHGHIDKYMGDGIMCEFGAPLDFATYRLLAVLAGIKMQERVVRLEYPWTMRIGIASGSTITGLIGSKRQTYTAIGDVVNLASRLEKLCAPGRVLVDRYTYEDVSRFIDARKRHDLPAREIHDTERERQLAALHERLAADERSVETLFEIGRVHQALNEPVEAFGYYERALKLDPGHVQSKLAYAEVGLHLQEHGRISVKGKRKRVEAFEVVGLRDPLDNRDKIPPGLAPGLRGALARLHPPADVILPVEALDGRIGHSTVVAALADAIASALEVPERERTEILLAGFLADIGLEVVPHHLLNRQGALTAGEYELVKRHPAEGVRALRKLGYESEGVLAIVRASHEAFDGSGYPNGLRARRSRSARGSSSWRTPTTRSRPGARTASRGRGPRPSTRCAGAPRGASTIRGSSTRCSSSWADPPARPPCGSGRARNIIGRPIKIPGRGNGEPQGRHASAPPRADRPGDHPLPGA
jgi:class 3 adenylate cyclase